MYCSFVEQNACSVTSSKLVCRILTEVFYLMSTTGLYSFYVSITALNKAENRKKSLCFVFNTTYQWPNHNSRIFYIHI